MYKNILKNFIGKCDIVSVSMIIGAVTALLAAGFGVFASDCEEIPNEVLRLHILANSDSDDDQNLKYGLRDFLLSDLNSIFSGAESLEQASSIAENNLDYITKRAEIYMTENGYTYGVEIELTKMYFTTRAYGNVTLPAGNYKALRVIIGEGKGQNWWCVMFPPLCLPAVSENGYNKNTEPYFSKEASKAIENGKNGVEIRFAIYEWLEGLFNKTSKNTK